MRRLTHRLLLPALGVLAACQTAQQPGVAVPTEDPSAAYEALLAEVVTEDGYVHWEQLQDKRAPLDAYVAWLTRPGALPSDRDAAHATWLNAYNAWVLYGVLEAGIPASVKDVPGWVPQPGSGFFLEKTYALGELRVSLYVAEHTHVRGGFSDWRDHAALNCASGSCPPLRRELFDPRRLDAQLDDQTRRWANDPVRGWRLDGQTVVLSPLFEWYAEDYPERPGGVCELLAEHATAERRRELTDAMSNGCKTAYFAYDWRLNRPELAAQIPPRQ